jgi:hypothetical protein
VASRRATTSRTPIRLDPRRSSSARSSSRAAARALARPRRRCNATSGGRTAARSVSTRTGERASRKCTHERACGGAPCGRSAAPGMRRVSSRRVVAAHHHCKCATDSMPRACCSNASRKSFAGTITRLSEIVHHRTGVPTGALLPRMRACLQVPHALERVVQRLRLDTVRLRHRCAAGARAVTLGRAVAAAGPACPAGALHLRPRLLSQRRV